MPVIDPATGRKRLRQILDPDGLFPTQCRGTTKNGPCRLPPIIGSSVCRVHGGASPNTRAAADRRVQEAAAERAVRAILNGMNLDAEPVRDPALAMGQLAGRLLSGFEDCVNRINAVREAGREPSDVDLAERNLLGRELRSLVTDMTRLQVGVALASRYGASDGRTGDPGSDDTTEGTEAVLGQIDAPSIDSIVQAVLRTEHELETERLVKVEQARSQGQLPAGLRVVEGETEGVA